MGPVRSKVVTSLEDQAIENLKHMYPPEPRRAPYWEDHMRMAIREYKKVLAEAAEAYGQEKAVEVLQRIEVIEAVVGTTVASASD